MTLTFDYKLGTLEYRSVRFENELLDKPSFQGNAAVNYTDRETPWTRIIEHKWFEFGKDENGNDLPKTIISREYSSEWKPGDEPYYPVNDAKTAHCMPSTRSWPTPSRRSSSADAWVSIRITTWIRLSPPCWTAAKASCTKVQPSESTKFKGSKADPQKAKIGVYFSCPFLISLNPLAPLATTPPSIRMSAPVRKMPCRTPSRSEALRSATAACGGSWRGDPPERCLSR